MLWFCWLYGGIVGVLLLALALDTRFGLPKLADLTRPEWDRWPELAHPRLTVIVPALNEEEGIEACLQSLAAQDYDQLEIIAVNDRSTDCTGALMEKVAATSRDRIRVLHISELPAGWLGKTHAMWKAAQLASGDWLLFTDGDVIFRPDVLRRAVAYAERTRADHCSLVPTMLSHTIGERMCVSLFYFGMVAARPWKIADPDSRYAIGAGAFNLVRRSAYQAVGTFEALRLRVIEDVGLALRLKRAGFASRIALGPGLVRIHWAKGAMGIVRTLTKNVYALVGFRWYLAALLALAGLATHVAPFIFFWLAPGWSKLGFGLSLACLFYFYIPFRRLDGINPGYFLLHPVAGCVMTYAVLRSAAFGIRHGAVVWRGTRYPIEELRRPATQ